MNYYYFFIFILVERLQQFRSDSRFPNFIVFANNSHIKFVCLWGCLYKPPFSYISYMLKQGDTSFIVLFEVEGEKNSSVV